MVTTPRQALETALSKLHSEITEAQLAVDAAVRRCELNKSVAATDEAAVESAQSDLVRLEALLPKYAAAIAGLPKAGAK